MLVSHKRLSVQSHLEWCIYYSLKWNWTLSGRGLFNKTGYCYILTDCFGNNCKQKGNIVCHCYRGNFFFFFLRAYPSISWHTANWGLGVLRSSLSVWKMLQDKFCHRGIVLDLNCTVRRFFLASGQSEAFGCPKSKRKQRSTHTHTHTREKKKKVINLRTSDLPCCSIDHCVLTAKREKVGVIIQEPSWETLGRFKGTLHSECFGRVKTNITLRSSWTHSCEMSNSTNEDLESLHSDCLSLEDRPIFLPVENCFSCFIPLALSGDRMGWFVPLK